MTYIIAEIGTSHQGSLSKAKDLISAARDSGANCAKFQWVYANEILHPDTGFVNLPTGKIRLYDRFKELEVQPDFFANAADFSHKCGLDFACSPFGLKSLSELLAISPDIVKIASPELNHFPMLKFLSQNMPKTAGSIILSSGVSRLDDIKKSLSILNSCYNFQYNAMRKTYCGNSIPEISLLHCITSYPAPETEYNLNVIRTLKNELKISMGVSDHSLDSVLVPALSVLCGGVIIEKHIALSRETSGLDDPVALTPEMFSNMTCFVRKTENWQKQADIKKNGNIPEFLSEMYSSQKINATLGNGIKELAPSEKCNYSRTNRSLHYLKSMKKGTVIQTNDIAVLRTEKELSPGISPEFFDEIAGHTLICDITSGEGVQWNQFE